MKNLRILFIALASLAASSAFAQVTIDQAKALAGGVTPGDAAGFPVTISQPGSYKLTGNLTVPQGVKGIVISVANVTLDLNGFTINGPSTCTRDNNSRTVTCSYWVGGVSVGIDASLATGTVVRNGTIRGFGSTGVNVGDLGRYEDLRVTWNAIGINDSAGMTQFGNTFSNCVLDTNAGDGMTLNSSSLVSHCRAINNGGDGFNGASSLVISESQAMGNRGNGLKGGAARGTFTGGNGVNRVGVQSMGGNLDNGTVF